MQRPISYSSHAQHLSCSPFGNPPLFTRVCGLCLFCTLPPCLSHLTPQVLISMSLQVLFSISEMPRPLDKLPSRVRSNVAFSLKLSMICSGRSRLSCLCGLNLEYASLRVILHLELLLSTFYFYVRSFTYTLS